MIWVKYMAIDVEAARARQRELNMVSDEVASVKRKTMRHKETLDSAWRSTEIRGIDTALEDVIYRLNRLSTELQELGHDVLVTAEEIREEEEAAEAEALMGENHGSN